MLYQYLKLLTDRERLILRFIAKGCSYKQIAERLFISPETVKKHLSNTYKKLNAANKIEALRKAGLLLKIQISGN